LSHFLSSGTFAERPNCTFIFSCVCKIVNKMGSIFSSLMMMTGSIAAGVLSAMAARAAAIKDWSKAKLYAYIAIGISVVISLLALALLIKSKTSAAGAMDIAPGFDLSMVLMMIVMAAMTVMNIFAVVNATSTAGQQTRKAEEFAAGSAALGFAGVILSLVLIIVLM
jgi:hypothetical protein